MRPKFGEVTEGWIFSSPCWLVIKPFINIPFVGLCDGTQTAINYYSAGDSGFKLFKVSCILAEAGTLEITTGIQDCFTDCHWRALYRAPLLPHRQCADIHGFSHIQAPHFPHSNNDYIKCLWNGKLMLITLQLTALHYFFWIPLTQSKSKLGGLVEVCLCVWRPHSSCGGLGFTSVEHQSLGAGMLREYFPPAVAYWAAEKNRDDADARALRSRAPGLHPKALGVALYNIGGAEQIEK